MFTITIIYRLNKTEIIKPVRKTSQIDHLLLHVNGEDGISTPEQLRVFSVWILIGEHDDDATFPVLQVLHRFVFRLQLQLC